MRIFFSTLSLWLGIFKFSGICMPQNEEEVFSSRTPSSLSQTSLNVSGYVSWEDKNTVSLTDLKTPRTPKTPQNVSKTYRINENGQLVPQKSATRDPKSKLPEPPKHFVFPPASEPFPETSSDQTPYELTPL